MVQVDLHGVAGFRLEGPWIAASSRTARAIRRHRSSRADERADHALDRVPWPARKSVASRVGSLFPKILKMGARAIASMREPLLAPSKPKEEPRLPLLPTRSAVCK